MMNPFEHAWTLLKARKVWTPEGFIPASQQTLHGTSVGQHGWRGDTKPSRTNTGLNYYVTVPREDLREGSDRRYAIRRGDTNEIVGDFPMTPIYEDGRIIGHKPKIANVGEEHRGQNLYARALLSLLSAPEAGTPVVSSKRNRSSQPAHKKLMSMYESHPHSSVQLTPSAAERYAFQRDMFDEQGNLKNQGLPRSGAEDITSKTPIGHSDEIIYHPLDDEGYGSLRQFDPGGLPLRVIDLPSNQTPLPGVQSTLDAF